MKKVWRVKFSTRQFMVVYLLVILLMAVFGGIRIQEIQKETEKNMDAEIEEKLERGENILNDYDQQARDMLLRITKWEGLFQSKGISMSDHLRELQEGENYIVNMYLGKEEKIYSASQSFFQIYGVDEVKATMEKSGRSPGIIVYSDPYYSHGCAGDTVCAALTSYKNRQTAAIEWNLENLYTELEKNIGRGLKCFWVSNQNGDLILFDEKAGGEFVRNEGFPLRLREEYEILLKQESDLANTIYTMEENTYNYIFSDSSNLHWKLYLVFDKNDLQNGQGREIQQLYLWVILGMIILGIVVYGVTGWINRPLRELGNKMEQIKAIEDMQTFPINREDEIGKLYSSYNRMIQEIQGLIIDLKESEKKKLEQEIKALQNQIGPHFLHNTLICIQCLLQQGQGQKAQEALEALTSLLSYSFRDSYSMVRIHEVIRVLQDYVCIQKMRYGDCFSFQVYADDTTLDYEIPKLVIQPIVENAIFHGIIPKDEEDGVIEVHIYQKEEILYIEVKDNGVGMSEEQKKNLLYNQEKKKGGDKLSGLGVYNVNERMHLKYGDDYGIEIQSEQGTTVILKFPCRK